MSAADADALLVREAQAGSRVAFNSFVALAPGLGALRPASVQMAAAAPLAAPRMQGLGGPSFAQTAAGRTLPAFNGLHDAGPLADSPPGFMDWGVSPPEPAASRPIVGAPRR